MEIRQSEDHHGMGLYATRSYSVGEIIFEESPLCICLPNSQDSLSTLRAQFKTIKTTNPDITFETPLDDLSFESSDIDSHLWNEARGMLSALVMYTITPDSPSKQKLFELYYPKDNLNTYESNLIQLSTKIYDFAKTQVHGESSVARALQEQPKQPFCAIMMIWRCNSFKGGLIYEKTSRINHSCDFNAVVSTESNSLGMSFTSDKNGLQLVKAAANIQPGDEILISYLGSFTYAGYKTRQKILAKEKFFDCSCSRCKKECADKADQNHHFDFASSIPCPKCHPREGRYLTEDDQYDDDDCVSYCYPLNSPDDSNYYCMKCEVVSIEESVLSAIERTIEKAMQHLEEGLASRKGMGIDDEEEERYRLLEMTDRFSALSLSVLGMKHWVSNLIALVSLGRHLSLMHASMICGPMNDKGIDSLEVAECVDTLQRIWKFVESLRMVSHPGHLLGNVTIGVARVLIGLGDLKSMKYGSEWAEKVYENYFAMGFEGEASAKVVQTLMSAWKRKSDETVEENEPKKKKANI